MWRKAIAVVTGVLCLTVLGAAAPSRSPVADAAMQKDRAAVQALLRQAADVNSAQGDGMTALHWAAMNDDPAMAQMLLYAGADVNAVTRLVGFTPLDLAARNGAADVVRVLLEGGADPKRADLHGTTALMFAAASGNVAAVTALLDAGAAVNAHESFRHETALMFAAAHGRADVVKLLLAHGADWKATTTVFDWAKLPKTDPRVAGAFFPGTRPEETAAGKGTVGAGGGAPATRERPAKDGPAPAGKARAANEPRRATYPDLVGTQGGLTALLFAARDGHLDTMTALVDAGADVNQADPGDDTTPLLIAIINGHFDAAEYLLAHGANPNTAARNGAAPLYAVVNTQWHDKSEYPFPFTHEQQKTTYLQLMTDLLARGANPNARLKEKVWWTNYNLDQSGIDEAGATPFWRAAYADDVEAMKLLVAHGADPTIPTYKPAGRPRGVDRDGIAAPKTDPSGLPPVPVGGPDIPPIVAAAGAGYGHSFTANHHRYAPTGMLAAVKYLVEVLHADVNAHDADGNTALHQAAARGDNAMVLYLVSKGANVRAVNRAGQTVADLANGPYQRIPPYPETMALLQKLGAQVEHKCVSC
ncbi:MAG: ankyrin repeat domain-containing protein [Acidobacteriota bacterium]|nr:ankyrin repeat domain-containing protein [Acidobacteriota bacterium]